MKILLLGANGQVGRELSRTLLSLGDVVALGREQLNLAVPELMRPRLFHERPDIIVNAAAYTAVDKAEQEEGLARAVNAESVAEMAAYANDTGALVVHYSTDYVFDGSKQGAYQPTDATNPQNAYGRTKRAGEIALQESGCGHLIFRTSWVYSARGQNFIKTILRLASEREELQVVADQIGAPTSASLIADVTSLALAGLRKDEFSTGIYHLTASGATTWHGLACRIVERAIANGRKLRLRGSDIHAIGTADFPTPATRPANSCMDSSGLEEALDLHFPDWTIDVDRVVDWITKENAS
ncbi:dTDP-4-dehydrorhamnose reductase [Guyparkeria sp. SCN-R1]|uniref:dTDP-4-dehydrorhamnose reductase n=1 Tax=Guyparkeria sp. SCN-R1 TaxID=2341113 RepID=UPI000F64DA31|nr:dTDP-4-dehydrorhamnose reductase [Guyparkeria sp. SCN-R1]RRQ23923.1 dTDP-4-dehydrorhamnose reductase [Guyparkeria sp. SCN-R1]